MGQLQGAWGDCGCCGEPAGDCDNCAEPPPMQFDVTLRAPILEGAHGCVECPQLEDWVVRVTWFSSCLWRGKAKLPGDLGEFDIPGCPQGDAANNEQWIVLTITDGGSNNLVYQVTLGFSGGEVWELVTAEDDNDCDAERLSVPHKTVDSDLCDFSSSVVDVVPVAA